MGVDLAGDVEFVLDRDRHPQQRPLLAAPQPRLGLLGFEQRPLGEDGAEGDQLRVEPLDPLQAEPHQLARRDLAGAHQLRLPSRPGKRQLLPRNGAPVSHAPILAEFPIATAPAVRRL